MVDSWSLLRVRRGPNQVGIVENAGEERMERSRDFVLCAEIGACAVHDIGNPHGCQERGIAASKYQAPPDDAPQTLPATGALALPSLLPAPRQAPPREDSIDSIPRSYRFQKLSTAFMRRLLSVVT
jgi:hypothetical protein